MKRITRILGMMVAATLTLTNCNKVSSIEEPAAKLFTIRANTGADSKTTNDGMHTLWAENDKVSLLYAPAGTDVTSEFTNVPMTIASGAGTSSAEFTGEVSLSGSNDFYAIYPHSGALKIPGQRNSGYIYVGNKNGVTQNGYDSMAHLSGSDCPMYGVALDNDDETIPEFSMKQLASVMELNIKNESGSEIVITKVEVEASEDIVGSYYIDIAAASPVYTSSGASYVSDKAAVNVTNGTALAANATAKVYVPIKPYTQAAGTPLKVIVTATVSGSTSTATVNITPASEAAKRTFTAGKIKRIAVNASSFTGVSTNTLAQLVTVASALSSGSTSTETYTVEGAKVMAKNGSNVILEDDTDIMLYYGSNSGINVGDVVTVSGNVKNHFYTAEIVSGSLTKTDTFTPDYSSPASFNAAAFKAAYDAHQVLDVNLVSFTGTVDAEGKYVSIDGTTLKSGVYGLSSTLKGKDVTVVGYPVGVGSDANGNPINLVPVSVEERGGVTPPPATNSYLRDLVSVAAALESGSTSTESYTVENVKVMAKSGSNVILQDNTDIMLYYGTNSGINVGDVVTVSGNVKNHFYTAEIVSGSLTKTDTFTPDYSGPASFNAAAFKAAYDAHQVLDVNLVSFTGTVDAEGKYVSIDGTTLKSGVYGLSSTLKGKDVTVVGYPVGVGSDANGNPINLVPVSVEERGGVTPPTPQTTTISSLLAVASSLQDGNTSSESYTVENAKVMAINGGNVIVSDATGTILYYENNLNGINAGDVVTMTGRVQNYHFLPEVTSGSLTKTGSFTPDYSSPFTNFNSDSYLATKEASTMLSIDLIKIEGTFNENASVFTVDGQTVTYTVFDQTANANKTCVVVGYPVGMSNSSKVKILPVTVTPKSSPAVVVSPSELSWGATETSTKTVTVTCGNDWTVTGAPTWLTVTKVDATSFTVTPTANTGAARNATLTVTNSANSSYTATVSVTQSAPAVVKYTDVIDASKLAATNTTYTDFSNVTCVSPAVYAGQSAKDGSGNIQMRSKNSNSGIVTTTSGGTVAAVRITVGSGSNRVDVYGTNTAYTSAADLYATGGNSNQGTLLGSVTSSGTITVTGDYKYIGIRSYNGAIYITKIEIDWK